MHACEKHAVGIEAAHRDVHEREPIAARIDGDPVLLAARILDHHPGAIPSVAADQREPRHGDVNRLGVGAGLDLDHGPRPGGIDGRLNRPSRVHNDVGMPKSVGGERRRRGDPIGDVACSDEKQRDDTCIPSHTTLLP